MRGLYVRILEIGVQLSRSFTSQMSLAWLFVLLVASGCGGQDIQDRRAVHGTVNLDGEPLATGSITFFPDPPGPVATGGAIQAGEFAIAKDQGLPVGTYKVSITSTVSTAPPGADANELMEHPPEVKSLVPRKYNSETTLKAEVHDTTENFFTFDLDSK